MVEERDEVNKTPVDTDRRTVRRGKSRLIISIIISLVIILISAGVVFILMVQ
ncbi:MAG: hypothetical protein ACMUHY_06865 [Thermoplasmatota archaeon]